MNRPQLAVIVILLVLGGAIAGTMLANRAVYDERWPCYVKSAMVKDGCLFFLPAEKQVEGQNKPLVEIRCKTQQDSILLNAIILESQSKSHEKITNAADQRFALLASPEIRPMQITIRTTVAGKDSLEVRNYTITRVEMLSEVAREAEGKP